MPVEAESQLLTINERQYMGLPSDGKTTPRIFQQVVHEMTWESGGTTAYLIVGISSEKLNQCLAQLLVQIKEYGFRFRLENAVYQVSWPHFYS